MHPNDACEHGAPWILCNRGCIEKKAKEHEEKVNALVATLNEVQAMRANLKATQERCTQLINEARRYKAALQQIQQWDCLNPPQGELCADLPWLKKLVDEALGD